MIKVSQNVPLRPLNTMGIAGNLDALVEWSEPADLATFFTSPNYAPLRTGRVKAIGEGSNLLFVNDGFRGTILLSRYNAVEEVARECDTLILRVGAGKKLDELIAETASQGLWGAENLSLIPGTIGAAAVQNVGAYGVEFSDLILAVRCYDIVENRYVELAAEGLRYGYRESAFKHITLRDRIIIVSVDLRFSLAAQPNLTYGNLSRQLEGKDLTPQTLREAVIETRRGKLPEVGETGSSGSFFKNPVIDVEQLETVRQKAAASGIDTSNMPAYPTADGYGVKLSAAWLIDRAGWKGVIQGNVGTWPTQPLVIVNLTGTATGEEVARLASEISQDINRKFGVELNPEVEYL